MAEFLACVHCAVLPFRATALAKAAGPREASVACAKVMVFLKLQAPTQRAICSLCKTPNLCEETYRYREAKMCRVRKKSGD